MKDTNHDLSTSVVILDDICLRFTLPHSTDTFGSAVHDDNVRLELHLTENSLYLMQHPVIDLEGSYISFKIPVRCITFEQVHDTVDRDLSKIRVCVDSLIKPHAVTTPLKPINESMYLANLRSWCTIPFRNLPAGSTLEITSKDREDNAATMARLTGVLKECSARPFHPNGSARSGNSRSTAGNPSMIGKEASWTGCGGSKEHDLDHNRVKDRYVLSGNIYTNRPNITHHASPSMTNSDRWHHSPDQITKTCAASSRSEVSTQKLGSDTSLTSPVSSDNRALQKWEKSAGTQHQSLPAQPAFDCSASITMDKWHGAVQKHWQEKAAATRYKPNAMLAALRKRNRINPDTGNGKPVSQFGIATTSEWNSTPQPPQAKLVVGQNRLTHLTSREQSQRDSSSENGQMGNDKNTPLMPSGRELKGKGSKLEKGGALFRSVDPDAWKQYMPWLENASEGLEKGTPGDESTS